MVAGLGMVWGSSQLLDHLALEPRRVVDCCALLHRAGRKGNQLLCHERGQL